MKIKLVWLLFAFGLLTSLAHGQAAPGSDVSVPSIVPTPVTLPTGATPKVSSRANYITNNRSVTTITNFLNGTPGQNIQIFCGDSTTAISSNATILLSDTWSCPDSVSIQLTLLGTVWTETGRFGVGGGGGSGTVSPGTPLYLGVYTGSTTVGSSSLPAASVPLTTTANTFTNSQTFSADPIFGSTYPWTDVRSKGALCNGSNNDTTAIINTLSGLATNGGSAFLPNNCLFTPPTTLPSTNFIAPLIQMGGALNITSTLHISSPYELYCAPPALGAPGNTGTPLANNFQCPLKASPTAFSVSPMVAVDSNAFVLKDLYLQQFCGSGIQLFPGGNGDAGIVDNVLANGANCAGNSVGVEQDHGFGVWYKGGGFLSSRLGTTPSMWMHSLSAQDPPGSITTFDHTFLGVHGIRYDTSGSLCAGNGITDNIRSVQQLYETANAAGNLPPDPNSPMFIFDVAHCTYRNLFIDSPEMVDTYGPMPMMSVLNSTGTPYGAVNGTFLLNPIGDFNGPFFGSTPIAPSSSNQAASIVNSTIFSPSAGHPLGLYGQNCSYFSYVGGNQVNCSMSESAPEVPVADITGHAIGMSAPPGNSTGMSCSASASGGSLATGTYYVMAVAEGQNISGTAAESVIGDEYVIPVTGPTGSIACSDGNVTFGLWPVGATGIRFYYGTLGSLQENVYERANPGAGNFNTFTIVGSGSVSATPAQLLPNPTTMAVTDVLGGQYPTVGLTDRPTYAQPSCFGIGMRCLSLGNFRTQINGNESLYIGGFNAVVTHANSADRTYTLPDATGTICLVTTCTGTGSVSSVGLVGTANQVTVTGASPITGSGSWTLSIPSSPTFPGTTHGTFSGNITGNVTGNVTGNLTGNVTGNTSGTAGSFTGNLTGDVTSVGMATTIATTGVTPVPCGDATHSCSLTVNTKGQVLTISNNNILSALADPGSNGIVVRNALNTTVGRTLTAGTGIAIANGTGVAGNPTVSVSASIDTRSFQWTQGNIGASALTTANVQPQPIFNIPVASTLVEVDVFVDAGASTAQLGFWHSGSSTTLTPILTPATVAGVHYNVACANTGGTTTTIQGTSVTCSTLSNTALAAKDFISTIGGTADGTSAFISITGIYTVN